MNSRLSKFFALALALTIALPALAFAQSSRVLGLGIQGDYIKDYTGMLAYPGGVSANGNLVFGELGSLTSPGNFDRSVGAVLGNLWDGRMGTWAVFLREQATNIATNDQDTSPSPGGGVDPNLNTNSSFDIEWGKQMGTMRLGARLRRAFNEVEATTAGVTTTLDYDVNNLGTGTPPDATGNLGRNVLGVSGGVQWEWSSTSTMDVAFHWDSRTFSSEVSGVGTVEEDSPTSYLLNARMFWQWQPTVTIVPVFKWYSYDVSVKPSGVAAIDATLKGWQIGAAGNWALGSNDLFVWGLTFAQNKVEQDDGGPFGYGGFLFTGDVANDITETFTPEMFASLETHVNPWLTLRFGARNGVFHTVKAEDTNGANNGDTEKVTDSPFSMNLGAGVKVGTLQLDGVMNDLFPFTGGYLFSGSSAGPAFFRISATYPF